MGVICEICNEILRVIAATELYRARLDPPLVDARVAHGQRETNGSPNSPPGASG